MGKLLIAGFVVAELALLLPIWRGAGHSRQDGVSFPELLYDSSRGVPGTPFGHPHILYEEAVRRAQEAYWGVS